MENEFIPYDVALAMKELGFDEPCYEYFTVSKDGFVTTTSGIPPMSYDFIKKFKVKEEGFKVIVKPLYQQTFRWFREKYNMNICIQGFENNSHRYSYTYCIYNKHHQLQDYEFNVDTVNTYEQAELACLRKLIEIVKNKED